MILGLVSLRWTPARTKYK